MLIIAWRGDSFDVCCCLATQVFWHPTKRPKLTTGKTELKKDALATSQAANKFTCQVIFYFTLILKKTMSLSKPARFLFVANQTCKYVKHATLFQYKQQRQVHHQRPLYGKSEKDVPTKIENVNDKLVQIPLQQPQGWWFRIRERLGIDYLATQWKLAASTKYIKEDTTAAVTVAALALPLSLAISVASGVPAHVGIASAIGMLPKF